MRGVCCDVRVFTPTRQHHLCTAVDPLRTCSDHRVHLIMYTIILRCVRASTVVSCVIADPRDDPKLAAGARCVCDSRTLPTKLPQGRPLRPAGCEARGGECKPHAAVTTRCAQPKNVDELLQRLVHELALGKHEPEFARHAVGRLVDLG